MVDHSTTLTRVYSSALIYYLVPLALDHIDHGTTTIFVRIRIAKVDMTTGQAENMVISVYPAICSASTNMVGLANITYICTSGFRPYMNINNSV